MISRRELELNVLLSVLLVTVNAVVHPETESNKSEEKTQKRVHEEGEFITFLNRKPFKRCQ
jgi:hypothetical protein